MSAASQELVRIPSSAVAPVAAPKDIGDVQRLGNLLAASGYFSDAREMAQAAVKVMAGQELGIPPVAAMMGINIIKGKVALSGNLIASRIKAHGYDYRHIQFNDKGCSLRFFSKKGETLGESSFTEDDAKAAGLLGSDMYKKYPRNMYFNRAISNGARWYCPEIFSGMPVYTAEELGATVDSEGEIIHTEKTAAEVKEEKLAQVPAEIRAKYEHPTQPKQPDVPEDEKVLRARMGDKYKCLDVFGEYKSDAYYTLGEEKGEEWYRSVLAEHGVQKSDQFKTLGAARECAVAMHRRLKALRADHVAAAKAKHIGEPAGEITDDPNSWVPENIGGAE